MKTPTLLTSSRDQRRLEYMGWRFEDIQIREVEKRIVVRWVIKRGPFLLSCALDTNEEAVDLGRFAIEHDRFSREKLARIGFSSAEIDEMERLGREFDEANPL